MNEDQTERLPHVPPLYRSLFERCYTSFAGRAARVKAKCLDCCHYQRLDVAKCTTTACPLWPIRPYQTKEELDDTHQDGDGDKSAAEIEDLADPNAKTMSE